ncbi:MAG: hypothetical protein R3F53_24390 [Gammaproteobacteria bacterium]
MIEKLFANTVYVKVFPNRFELKHIEPGRSEVEVSSEPFTTARLLVGKFSVAECVLKRGMKRLHEKRWFSPSPIVVIQPMEKTDNGLSEVEERVLLELAAGAGARKVSIWVGNELSDDEVTEKAARA